MSVVSIDYQSSGLEKKLNVGSQDFEMWKNFNSILGIFVSSFSISHVSWLLTSKISQSILPFAELDFFDLKTENNFNLKTDPKFFIPKTPGCLLIWKFLSWKLRNWLRTFPSILFKKQCLLKSFSEPKNRVLKVWNVQLAWNLIWRFVQIFS